MKDSVIQDDEIGIWIDLSKNDRVKNSTVVRCYHGIKLDESSQISIVNSTVKNCEKYGFWANDSSNITIENSSLNSNNIGILLNGSSSNNQIKNSSVVDSEEEGIMIYNSSNTMVKNVLVYNDNWGIDLLGTENTEIHYSDIYGNETVGVSNSGSKSDATHNWWGHKSGPYHSEENPDGNGDKVVGDVEFDPWLEAPSGLERMSADEAAYSLSKASPMEASERLAGVPKKSGEIIDAGVKEGLTDNLSLIVKEIDHSVAASILMESSPFSSAKIVGSILKENILTAARIADEGAKENLKGQASILEEMETETVAKLLIGIYNLPETPEAAANLLEAMSLNKSVAVIRIMIKNEKFDFIDGMFSKISDEKLNDIYSNLTEEQKEELLPHLSPSVKDRMALKKPLPLIMIASIIGAIVIVGGIFIYLRRR